MVGNVENNIVHSGLPSLAFDIEEIYINGKEGYVYSVSGKKYIDFVLGYGAVILGHGTEAFHEQFDIYLKRGNLLPGYTTWHSQLIDLLTHTANYDLSAAFFKTGSEAVTASIRLSSYITNKKSIIRCGFLGWHDVLLGDSLYWHEPINSPFRYEKRFKKGFRGISDDEKVFNWSSLRLDDLEKIITNNKENISCFIIDTYQVRFSSMSLLESSIKLCKKYDILVIADETKTAGRVAPLGVVISRNLNVDFIIGGKALANGFPLSILFGKPEYMNLSEKVRITGTFSQELSAIYGALTTFSIMTKNNGYSLIRNITKKIVTLFNNEAIKQNVNDHVRAEKLFDGAMFELVFLNNCLSNWENRTHLCKSMAKSGILILQGHPSYTCIGHYNLDYEDLTRRISAGFAEWKKHLLFRVHCK